MTHDKKSGVYFLCTFRDLKRLCGHAGVSGYLLFSLFALLALISPPVFLLSCVFFFFVFSNDYLNIHVLLALSHPFEDDRCMATCLFPVFTLLFICLMMRYVFDVFTFNGSFLYLPCQQDDLLGGLFSFDDRHNCR